MPQSLNPDMYKHVEPLCQKAKDSKKGVRVKVDDVPQAASLRFQCYGLRNALRAQSAKIFPEDHLEHGKCEFDTLRFSIEIKRNGEVFLLIQTPSAEEFENLTIEEL